ncbi:hypothetical protein AcW1_007253 [Taiwanofungus camphoratus]|nr:hypothetical protein AcW2_007680 [Antrodia cinnamomea]KAI0927536.1 hypothetical protein AcV5_008049 [Antrodia cinnamomea]KAI0952891.1 hypothetical protein AcW1_007253 [Antrodia cinnamomea]
MALYMSTILSRTTSDIISHLAHIRASFASHVALFTLSVSPHSDSSEVSALVSTLTSLSSHSAGCLSANLNPENSIKEHILCSVAIFDSGKATPFRSTIPGKPAVQVGRWHSFRKRDEQDLANATHTGDDLADINWEDVWARKTSSKALPSALQALSSEDVNNIIYLSDSAPDGLSSALRSFPLATKLGLIASSTPFVTGRPFTLFYGTSIHSTGAVGLCLTSSAGSRSHVEFPGLEAITAPLIVTSSEGNLVHSLNNASPSRLLLNVIQKRKSSLTSKDVHSPLDVTMKDDQFYLGVLRQTGGVYEAVELHQITSGDPSRGSFALEGDNAPPEGTRVQIYELQAHASPNVLSRFLSRPKAAQGQALSLTFAVSPSDVLPPSPAGTGGANTVVIPDTFLAASENGFIVDRCMRDGEVKEGSWRCTVPGGSFSLEWDL